MSDFYDTPFAMDHDHVFLGPGHEKNERKTWAVIALCGTMMLVEIIGGNLFGSLALVADGLHMSTHAGAMLIAALAYTYARKHANDTRFVFGTGKLGDLAGFTSAIILAMIAMLIGYEAISRFMSPVPIRFGEAIPIAVVGLLVNVVSAWLLSGDDHHGHSHSHGHDDHAEHSHDDEVRHIETAGGVFALSIFEEGVPPVFRLQAQAEGAQLPTQAITVTTIRPNGARQDFTLSRTSDFLESTTAIPEPYAFMAVVRLPEGEYSVAFEEHDHHAHGIDTRDHNMRAAYIHVIADAAVSVLAIIGLLLAKTFGWMWMDPVAGMVGALVIANWSYGLVRNTGGILMDINPGNAMTDKVRAVVETAGDRLIDLHVWRLGPGHYGAVISVITQESQRGPSFYHAMLRQLKGLSHLTVEVHAQRRAALVDGN
ncbi:CDF family Co(II)/Ni(II) efflux transporter DmeF [Dyella subtropica]|uniref:CDF family Co(II)/Ni(II) efflux transporter DmeF n=1 Tax=Dyella subtropica TaxID=2992127 RepID=UPI002B1CC908|nr:CDF family Co(II)/Ni(II) efflux transporter DmeF [Dyella subtropica]